MVEPKTWHRQRGETDRAFRAFTLYINQPPPRSLLFVRNAGYAPASVQKWKKNHNWIQRSIDYDNERADAILEKETSVLTQVQLKVSEASLEDTAIMQAMWRNAAARVQTEFDKDEMTAFQYVSRLDDLVKTRLDIEKLARLAARMPSTYNAQVVPEEPETFPQSGVVELTLGKSVQLMKSEFDDDEENYGDNELQETSGATEQLSSQIISIN